jgi:hypothetical protein
LELFNKNPFATALLGVFYQYKGGKTSCGNKKIDIVATWLYQMFVLILIFFIFLFQFSDDLIFYFL